MTPEQLDEIEQRADQAAQGPWEYVPNEDYWEMGNVTNGDTQVFYLEGEPIDAKFIAAARTDVPQLVAEVRKLQERVEHYRNLWQGTIKDSQEVLDRNHDLEAQIEAVEKLHRPSTEKVDGAGVTYRMCLHCTYINRYGQQRYPCLTIQALEGESDE